MILKEIKRGFLRASFIVALGVGLIICIRAALRFQGSAQNILRCFAKANVPSVYDYFILIYPLMDCTLLIYIIPILASLPYSDSYIEDIESGVIKYIYTRENKDKYLISKFISNFILGGIVVALPLLVNYIIIKLRVPTVPLHPILGNWALDKEQLFVSLYYMYPDLYIFIWILFYFLFGGMLASIALSLSTIVKKRKVIFALNFILALASDYLLDLFNVRKYSVLYFMDTKVGVSLSIILVEVSLLILLSFIIFYCRGKKSENL